jgi:4-diphosphocytidyl-2-C-methyl-D-erythritol kinase
VLRALDALSPHPLGARLVEIASSLGADVPFMAIDSPLALGWSRGERLLPLRPLEPRTVVLLVPDFPVATADAYGWVAADRGAFVPDAAVINPESLATWEGLASLATNDFERVVARRHPRIAELVDDLASFGAAPAMMSGSGSTVFGIFETPPDAGAIARSSGCPPIVVRTAERVGRPALQG